MCRVAQSKHSALAGQPGLPDTEVGFAAFPRLFCASACARGLGSRVQSWDMYVVLNFPLPSTRFGLKVSFAVKTYFGVIEADQFLACSIVLARCLFSSVTSFEHPYLRLVTQRRIYKVCLLASHDFAFLLPDHKIAFLRGRGINGGKYTFVCSLCGCAHSLFP